MLGFRFLDEVYNSSKQNHRSLAVRNLCADILLDGVKIGKLEGYYLNSALLDFNNLNFFHAYIDSLDKEDRDIYYNEGFYDEEDYEEYSRENFFTEGDYEGFLEDNDLEEIDDYIRNRRDILFIMDIKLHKSYDLRSLIEEFKNNLYLLFDYKNFLVMDGEENIIAQ